MYKVDVPHEERVRARERARVRAVMHPQLKRNSLSLSSEVRDTRRESWKHTTVTMEKKLDSISARVDASSSSSGRTKGACLFLVHAACTRSRRSWLYFCRSLNERAFISAAQRRGVIVRQCKIPVTLSGRFELLSWHLLLMKLYIN